MDNLEKRSYATVLSIGDEADFLEKMRLEGKSWEDLARTVETPGSSLLRGALANGHFAIAQELLNAGAPVNVLDSENNNEFEVLAPRLREEGAADLANQLLDRGVSLEQVEKRFKNTAMFSLLMEGFKKPSPEVEGFLSRALEQFTAWDHENVRGFTVRSLIDSRGSDALKAKMADVTDGR